MLLGSQPHRIEKIEVFSTYALIFKVDRGDPTAPVSFDRDILKQNRLFVPI